MPCTSGWAIDTACKLPSTASLSLTAAWVVMLKPRTATVALLTELGSDYEAAVVLTDAGDAHCDSGDLTAARDAWGQALAIFERLRHPNASKVAAKLSKAPYGDSRFSTFI